VNKTSRPRLVLTILLSISVLACSAPFDATMFDGQTPIIVGTITPSPIINGSPVTFLYVVADGATDNDCYPQRAYFNLDAGTMVYQNGSRKETSDLKIGRRVSVFADRAVIKPCMPVTTAHGVMLH
jgi:hypothetical protein